MEDFRIDSVGFYCNRKGEKVEIVRCPLSGVYKDTLGAVYDIWGNFASDKDYKSPLHLVTKWDSVEMQHSQIK